MPSDSHFDHHVDNYVSLDDCILVLLTILHYLNYSSRDDGDDDVVSFAANVEVLAFWDHVHVEQLEIHETDNLMV